MQNKYSENFNELSLNELSNTNGGFVITGAVVATGVGIFAASFGVGYSIGQARRRK